MIGVSDHLVNAVRAALLAGRGEAMMPIEGMDNHFCSLEEGKEDPAQFRLLFPMKIEQKQVYIYLKIS